jgi:hypothetical protein
VPDGELGFMDRWFAQKPGKRCNIHIPIDAANAVNPIGTPSES